MLDELVATIETLKRRILDHRNVIESYEMRTRITLIDPILGALGWDVADPSQVTIEPRGPNGWADYALLSENGKSIVVFLEAKKLAEKDTPITQTVGYAVADAIQNQTNVRYCASTNGDVWELYDITGQTIVLRTSIIADDAAKSALKLLGLWRQSIADGVYTAAVEPVVVIERQSTGNGKGDSTDNDLPPQDWVCLSDDFSPVKRAIAAIRLPDGQEVETKYWFQVIREMGKWLYKTGKLTRLNCRIPTWVSLNSSSKINIFSADGDRGDGKPFTLSSDVVDGITFEGNMSSEEVVRRARRILTHFNIDPATVSLRLP